MSPDATVADRLEAVHRRIESACRESGREPRDVRLIAVSKVHPPERIRQAYEAGQREFGESYVQEMRRKAEALSDLPDLRLRLIGHLQRNKVRTRSPSHRPSTASTRCGLPRRSPGARTRSGAGSRCSSR